MKNSRKKKLRKLAASMIVNWIGEAWHDLDCDYYNKMIPAEKEMVKYYIHRYGIVIGWVLGKKYRPH